MLDTYVQLNRARVYGSPWDYRSLNKGARAQDIGLRKENFQDSFFVKYGGLIQPPAGEGVEF